VLGLWIAFGNHWVLGEGVSFKLSTRLTRRHPDDLLQPANATFIPVYSMRRNEVDFDTRHIEPGRNFRHLDS
jgi:hypothetical protein